MKREQDKYQKFIYNEYHELIYHIIKTYPRLNKNGILNKIIEERDQWFRLPYKRPEIREIFLKHKPSPKTVRKHVNDMLALGMIEEVNRGFVTTYQNLPEVSKEINKNVQTLLSSKIQDNRNISHAGDVAACYISSSPEWSHEYFNNLINKQIRYFCNSIFWCNDIIEDAILTKHLSVNVYDPKKNKIDLDEFKNGLNKYFGNCNLFVFTIAIDPQKLIKFMTSHIGSELVTDCIQENFYNKLTRRRSTF